MIHTRAEQNKYLRALGFRFPSLNPLRRREAIRQFQLLAGLQPDGVYGLKTTFMMNSINGRGGRISDNFRFNEFACKCRGYSGCRGIKLDIKLVKALETVRDEYYPNGLPIVSAYRCAQHNAAVGGAKESQHLTGKAADIPAKIPHTANWPGEIRGIGYDRRSGKVRHIDTRPGPRVKWVY